MRRSAHLSPEAAAVLGHAAVAGRRFDFDVLRALTGHDEDRLLALVRALIAAQLVVEESADRFAFRHALTRQAIYSAMLARERRALHLIVAEAMERLHAAAPDGYLADLAYHFASGEAWAKAMAYGERAGTRALALYAPRAAAEYFARAMDVAARLTIQPSLRLFRERGRALALIGDFDGARGDYEAALVRAQADGDPHSVWQVLLDLGGLWAGYDYGRAGEYFERALGVARSLDSPQVLAESLAQLGGWHLNTERPDEAERCLQEARAIFEREGDRAGSARTTDLLGTVSDIAGDIARMRRRYERAAALFRELNDRQGLASTLATMLLPGGAYIFETVVIPPHMPQDETMREGEEALSLARAIDWRAGEAYVLLNLAVHCGAYGAYGRALQLARDGLAIAQELGHREWMTHGEWTHGMLLTDLLAFARAREHFGRAHRLARESGSLHWLYLTAGNLAESHAVHGDLDGAEAALAAVPADLPMRTLGQRRVWTAQAHIALGRGDPARALAIVERLCASAVNFTGPQDIPLLALLLSEGLVALGRYREAEEPLRAALAVATDRGLLPLHWRCHAALGRLYAAWGRNADARAQERFARAIVGDLAPTLADDRARGEFLARTAALLSIEQAQIPRRDGSTLTARERDVAALVARGLSNRDIADALSIGERTVETHVGNVLGKLGFGSRAQIAAWAVASRLARGAG